MDDTTLHAAIMKAHDQGDHNQLVTLYARAATGTNDIDAKCFYLTYAYIFALELGHAQTDALRVELAKHGRE